MNQKLKVMQRALKVIKQSNYLIKLIVGLGNPGAEYAKTRHNVGQWLVEQLADQSGQALNSDTKFFGMVARATIFAHDCRLLVPTTYMNNSGKSVLSVAAFYKILPQEILVVHDDLDLPVGTAKLKFAGGHGGHNGLRDIMSCLGSKDFYRLRLGIGHPGNKAKVLGHVLKKASKDDEIEVLNAIDRAIAVLPELFAGEFEKAMHKLHS